MNLQDTYPERPTKIEFKEFSFGEFFDNQDNTVESDDKARIVGADLFSLFTADIIKQDVPFTR